MLKAAIGVSDDIDLEDAIEQVLSQCRKQLGDTLPQVGILFTSCMDADFQFVLDRFNTALPSMELIGCTTDGEISPRLGFSEDSVALLLLSSDTAVFSTALAENISATPRESIFKAFIEAKQKLDGEPHLAIVFPDGLTTIATSLDTIFREIMGDIFPVIGGTAGDHFLLSTTYQFYGKRVLTDSMPVLLIGGQVACSVNVVTGLVPYGQYYKLSQVEKNIVYQVGDLSVLDFYQREFGLISDSYPHFSFSVYPKGSEDHFFRSPIAYDKNTCSMQFIGQFPEDCRVRLARVLREDIRRSADEANRKLLEKIDGEYPELILIFSCTSRRHVLGSETNLEFELLRNSSEKTPFFGFYCYGEIGPLKLGSPTRFHSGTFISLALRSCR